MIGARFARIVQRGLNFFLAATRCALNLLGISPSWHYGLDSGWNKDNWLAFWV
jgi:hypothetical protein